MPDPRPDGGQPGVANPDTPPDGNPPGGQPGGQPGGAASAELTAANTYSSDAVIANQTISSTGTDENAVLVTDGKVTIVGRLVNRLQCL